MTCRSPAPVPAHWPAVITHLQGAGVVRLHHHGKVSLRCLGADYLSLSRAPVHKTSLLSLVAFLTSPTCQGNRPALLILPLFSTPHLLMKVLHVG